MANYAIILGGVVTNVIAAATLADAQSVAALTSSSAIGIGAQKVSPGATYSAGVFTPPAAAAAQFVSESVQDVFGGKVTGAELTALGNLINTDPQVRVMWDLFAGWRLSTEAFLNYLVVKGTITAARRDQFKT